jgi:hypothetical protein
MTLRLLLDPALAPVPQAVIFRAAEKRDDFAALHSITSSAMESSPGGTSMPSARAV